MKALITGVTGFVGQHLASYLKIRGYQVWGTTRNNSGEVNNIDGVNQVHVDFDNITSIVDMLNFIQPDHIYHLAGQSSVLESWSDKVGTFNSNISLTMNLLEAIVQCEIKEKVSVLTVGSSEEYGGFDTGNNPVSENTPLKPISPYGISKATVSMLVRHYHTVYNLKIIHTRPFNHIGPGQRLGFVVSDFSNQIAQIEKGKKRKVISVGNLSAQRDFTDVRDIVKAYYFLLNEKVDSAWGESVNVCSGKATSIQSILETLLSLADCSIEVTIDSNKMRPVDIPVFMGDNTKLIDLTGWKPIISLEQTLSDVLKFYRDKS